VFPSTICVDGGLRFFPQLDRLPAVRRFLFHYCANPQQHWRIPEPLRVLYFLHTKGGVVRLPKVTRLLYSLLLQNLHEDSRKGHKQRRCQYHHYELFHDLPPAFFNVGCCEPNTLN
jgi:hypothetical protein